MSCVERWVGGDWVMGEEVVAGEDQGDVRVAGCCLGMCWCSYELQEIMYREEKVVGKEKMPGQQKHALQKAVTGCGEV